MAKTYEQDFPSLRLPEVRLALLMVEAVMGDGNADMLPDGLPCTCSAGEEARVHQPGCAGGPENSPALRPAARVAEWHDRYADELTGYPVLKNLLVEKPKEGVDAVYEWADLKAAEATALAMHHAGFQLPPIAKLLNRQDLAVRQLIQNGAWKLERALRLMAPVDSEPHCEICSAARDMLIRGPRQASRSA